jgi:hypothetical protein
MQTKVPAGATILGVIASSDKTALTTHTGGKVAHPVLLSLANINMAVRNKDSYHAFLLVGLLPIPKFFVQNRKLLSTLYHRLIHHCLDILFNPLKKIAHEGALMIDPVGRVRNVYTPLVSYIADNPETQMLAGVMGMTSPVTMAGYLEFGDSVPQRRRFGSNTVEKLQLISQVAHPWDEITRFRRLCNTERLSGVNKPFFRDWALSDPTWFLTPDRLHAILKKFWDHDVKWCIAALGEFELNFRFRVLHRRVGFRHFSAGISGLTMTAGREHRDIQRSIIAVIAGGCSKPFARCIRALVDFAYISHQDILTE